MDGRAFFAIGVFDFLLRFFLRLVGIAQGVQIRDEVVGFRSLQDSAEGWHLLSAFENLGTDLLIIEARADCGKVRTFGATVLMDGVALRAAIFGERLLTTDAGTRRCGRVLLAEHGHGGEKQ
jgi:hypothetical protein